MSDFDGTVRVCRRVLKLLGVWPDTKIDKQNWFARIHSFIPPLLIFGFCNMPQTMKVIEVWGDFNVFMEVITNSDVPIGLALFKLLGFTYNRNVLNKLLTFMMEDWNTFKTNDDKLIMQRSAKQSRFMSITIIILAELIVFFYLTTSIYGRILESKMLNVTEKAQYISSSFFYDARDGFSYEITWNLQWFSGLLASLAFSSFDAFFATVVLHLCGQLTILNRHLEGLSERSATKNGRNFDMAFSEIVSRHEHLSRFAESIEKAFSTIFLIQLLASSVVLCLQGFQLATIASSAESMNIVDLLFMTNYASCFIFSLFVYCYTCEKLRTEGMKLSDAAYGSDWYNMKSVKARAFILVIMRAHRPYEITAGKYVVFSLDLFSSVLKTCGGYVSMLLAMRDRMSAN